MTASVWRNRDFRLVAAGAFVNNAGDWLLAVAQMDVAVRKVVYTSFLNDAGGIKADLTIMRLARDHFRVVTLPPANSRSGCGATSRSWLTIRA